MIYYSTNWMGPVSLEWYRERNLTVKVTVVQEEDSKFTSRKKGDVYEREDVIEQWAGGRIDIRGDGLGPYGDECGLPIMHGTSYRLFSDWLDDLRTDEVWTLDMIVNEYEKTNPKIVWADDYFKEEK